MISAHKNNFEAKQRRVDGQKHECSRCEQEIVLETKC